MKSIRLSVIFGLLLLLISVGSVAGAWSWIRAEAETTAVRLDGVVRGDGARVKGDMELTNLETGEVLNGIVQSVDIEYPIATVSARVPQLSNDGVASIDYTVMVFDDDAGDRVLAVVCRALGCEVWSAYDRVVNGDVIFR